MVNNLSIGTYEKPCFFIALPLAEGAARGKQGVTLKPCFSKSTVNCQEVNTGCKNSNTDFVAKKEEKSSATRFEAGVTQLEESLPSNLITKMAEIQLQNGLKEAGRIPALLPGLTFR